MPLNSADRLGGLDVAFLAMESKQAPMHVGGVCVFTPAGPIDPHRLLTVLRERAARIPRLRQRVSTELVPPGSARWIDDVHYDPTLHVRAHTLPSGDATARDEYVSREMALPLDTRRPLWQATVITGADDGNVTVLMKLHHALADGMGALLLGLGLLDQHPVAAPPTEIADVAQRPTSIAGMVRGLLTDPRRYAGTAIERAFDTATQLAETVARARESAEITAAVLRSTRLPVTESPLLAGGSSKRKIVTRTLPLADVRAARARHGGTVNDVLLGVLTGAFRSWLLHRGTVDADTVVRALVPVSMRRPGRRIGAGNQLSGYLCELPVGIADTQTQVRSVRASMDASKSAGPLRGPGALPVLADRLPPALHRVAAPVAGLGAPLLFDTVITNVPLPSVPLSLDGAALAGIYPIVPLAAGHALTVGLLTYRGTVHIGLYADGESIPDLDVLADAVPEALRAMQYPNARACAPIGSATAR